MREDPLVIPSKLDMPRVDEGLPRQRLISQGLGDESKRIMTIIAGPGYGKTTIMAQIAKTRIGDVMWYQIDAMDEDPVVFLRHLVLGVSKAAGVKLDRSRQRLDDLADIGSEGEQIIELIYAELDENGNEPLILCFDDVHLVKNEYVIKMIGVLLELQPPEMFIILAGRYHPVIPLQQSRSEGAIRELRQRDLRFSTDETLEMMKAVWHMEPSQETLDQVCQRIDGWPAGMVLVEAFVKEHQEIPKLITNHRIRTSIYDYLTEEALAGLPDDLREVLMFSSVLDPIDPLIVERVTSISSVDRLLSDADEMNLFISKLEGSDSYRLHPMFKAFLAHLLEEFYGTVYIQQLHDRYGSEFEATGDWMEAVKHYISADSHLRFIPLLENHGNEMFASGEHITLDRWLETIDLERLTPPLYMYKGKIRMIAGSSEEAIDTLQAVHAKLGTPEQRCECALAIAECLGDIGKWQEGIGVLDQIDVGTLENRAIFEITFQRGGLFFAGYDNDGLEQCCEIAIKNLHAHHDRVCRNRYKFMLAMLNMRKGNISEAEKLLSSHDDVTDIHGVQRAAHINAVANCLLLSAKYEEACKAAMQSMKIVEELKHRAWYSPILDTQASLEFVRGDKHKALEMLDMSISKTIGKSQRAIAIAYCHKGTLMRWVGHFDDAYDYHKQAIEIGKSNNEKYDEIMGLVNVGADLIFLDELKQAKEVLSECYQEADRYDFGYAITKINYHEAWLAFLEGDQEIASNKLEVALRSAREKSQNHFIIQEGRLTLDMLSMALRAGIEKDYLCWILMRIGSDALTMMKSLLKDNDYRSRLAAVKVIGTIGDVKALTMLRLVSRDKDERVRTAARNVQKKLRNNIEKPIDLITNREFQIMELLNKGAQNSLIAAELYISEQTVKTHITNIMRKLGLNSRLEIALFFQENL